MAAVPSIGRATAVTPRPASRGAVATHDLYERYAKQIHNFCLHQLGNREEAEDATQSTFLNAFRGLERGVEPEFESAWLFKIAHNVCLTRQRSSFRRRRVESPGDLDAIQDLLPSPQRDADELIRLTDALHGMPEQQRKALLLREWQGLSYKEIGEELELSQPAVETLLFRARRSLAQGLTEEPKKEKGLRKRLRTSGDMGSVAALVKTLFFGGGAKVAATVATVAATSVVAATPAVRHDVAKLVGPAPAQPAVTHVATTVAPEAKAPVVHDAAPVVWRDAAADTVRPVAATPRRAAKPGHTAAVAAIAAGRVHGARAHAAPPAAPAAAAAPAPAQPAPEPAAAAPAATPTPAPTPAHEQPVTPPGQAKKDEGKKNDDRNDASPPAASTPSTTAPGQAKKDEGKKNDDRKDAPPPAASTPSTTPPGQAKKDEGKKDNGKKDEPTAQPQQQTQAAPPVPVTVQAQTPPGQAKKFERELNDATVSTAATPPAAPAPASPAPAAVPAPAPVADDSAQGKDNRGKKK